jgi:hypothetical protein
MDIVYFAIRYTPFWSIPVMFIAAYFAYTYWIKDIRIIAMGFSLLGLIAFLVLLFWIFTGGPDASVHHLLQFSE